MPCSPRRLRHLGWMNYLPPFAFQESVAGRVLPICSVAETPRKLLMKMRRVTVIQDLHGSLHPHGLIFIPFRGTARIRKALLAHQHRHLPSLCSRRLVRHPTSYDIVQNTSHPIKTIGPTLPWPWHHRTCVDFEAIAHQQQVRRQNVCLIVVLVRVPRLLRKSPRKNPCRVHGQMGHRHARATMVGKAITACDVPASCSCSLYISFPPMS